MIQGDAFFGYVQVENMVHDVTKGGLGQFAWFTFLRHSLLKISLIGEGKYYGVKPTTTILWRVDIVRDRCYHRLWSVYHLQLVYSTILSQFSWTACSHNQQNILHPLRHVVYYCTSYFPSHFPSNCMDTCVLIQMWHKVQKLFSLWKLCSKQSFASQ